MLNPWNTFANHQSGEHSVSSLVAGATLPSSTSASGSNSQLKRAPSRPPRNPARSSISMSDESMITTGSAYPASPELSLQTQQPPPRDAESKRLLTAPGMTMDTTAREETMPWEFQTTVTAEEIVHIPELQTAKVSPTRMTHPTIKHPYIDHPRSLRSGGGFSPNHSPRSSRMVISPTSSTLSLASLISASLSPPSSSVIFGKSRDPPQALSMSTGPISEVTPWELYPVPRRDSASASLISTSTSGGVSTSKSTSWLSSGSNPRLQIPPLTFKRSVQITGPVEEVTPWDLAPGPKGVGSTPPSPTRSKFSSRFKSKADSKHSARPVALPTVRDALPSSGTFTTSVPMNVWDNYRGIATTPAPLRSPKMSRKSTSQVSEKSQESRHSSSVQMSVKSSRTGSKGGKGKKESKPPVSMGMVERQRSLPLTGPLEEVAPWEMHPVPAIEVGDEGENEKKLSTSLFGSRARSRSSLSLGLGSCGNGHALSGISTPALVNVSNGSKWAGQTQTTGKGNVGGNYTHEDEQSISSAAMSRSSSRGPLSAGKVGGEKRVRTNSAAASSMSLDGHLSGEGEMTNPSLVLSANQAVDEEAEDMKEFSLVGQQFGKERISTNYSTISTSNLRSASSTHAPAVKAIPMVSSMSTSQVEEVTPWELCPVTPSPHRSASTRSEDKDRRPVSNLDFIYPS